MTDVQDPGLSPRELDVLRTMGEGKTVSQVAAVFGLSVKTVSTYRGRILDKLSECQAIESRTTAALIRYAIKSGLVS